MHQSFYVFLASACLLHISFNILEANTYTLGTGLWYYPQCVEINVSPYIFLPEKSVIHEVRLSREFYYDDYADVKKKRFKKMREDLEKEVRERMKEREREVRERESERKR